MNLLLTFVSRGLSAVFAFLFTLVLARTLTENDVGLYLTAFTVMTGLAIFIKFGLDSYLIKINAGLTFSEKKYNYFSLLTYTSVPFLVIGLPFIWLIEEGVFFEHNDVFHLFIITAWFISFLGLSSAYLRSLGKTPIASFIEVGLVPMLLIISYLFFQNIIDLDISVWFLFFIVSSLSVIVFLLIARGHDYSFSFMSRLSKVELIESFKIMLANLLDFLVLWLSAFILMFFVVPAEVAHFQISIRLALLIAFILVVINSVIGPLIASHVREKEFHQLSGLMQASSTLGVLLAFFPLLVLLIIPDVVLKLFGEGYVDAVPLVVILAVGQFVNVLSGSVGTVLVMSGHGDIYFKNTLYGVLTALFLGLLLMPEFGAVGAAISTSLAVIVKNLLGIYRVYRIWGVVSLPTKNGLLMIKNLESLNGIFAHRN